MHYQGKGTMGQDIITVIVEKRPDAVEKSPDSRRSPEQRGLTRPCPVFILCHPPFRYLCLLCCSPMKVNIINRSHHALPAYETGLSAGMDLRAFLEEDVVLRPLERALIPTGLYIALPPGYEAQVRPRSGLAAREGISVLNAPGTIDADYRGEIKVILVNLSAEDRVIRDGERIAQMIIARHERVEWNDAETLDSTQRGEGGFGHTGKS